jgi:hypothetical protein
LEDVERFPDFGGGSCDDPVIKVPVVDGELELL